jgi:hypothetical protein
VVLDLESYLIAALLSVEVLHLTVGWWSSHCKQQQYRQAPSLFNFNKMVSASWLLLIGT